MKNTGFMYKNHNNSTMSNSHMNTDDYPRLNTLNINFGSSGTAYDVTNGVNGNFCDKKKFQRDS